jgi:McrBC 5-methylcytosine restriction system component
MVRSARNGAMRSQIRSRYQRWLPLLDLSKLILTAEGFGYATTGHTNLPGYILRTEDAWETLVRMACRRAYALHRVTKTGYLVGVRRTIGHSRDVRGTPDITVDDGTTDRKLIDAKYKLGSDSVDQNAGVSALISSGDIYEALAFMQAASTNTICLVYPSLRSVDDLGKDDQPIETVTVGNRKIMAVSVGVSGIANHGVTIDFATRSENSQIKYSHLLGEI